MIKTSTTKIYNLIILDESGSMMSIKESVIKGFNEIIQSISHASKQKRLQQWINFYSFNGAGITEQIPLSKVDSLTELNEETYKPDNMTPLYDAIGFSVNRLSQAIEKETDYKVLVTILTDGEENASTEYGSSSIAALIKSLKKSGWVFTYMGANHDVEKVAISLHINSSMSFNASKKGMNDLVASETNARGKFYDRVALGNELKEDESYFQQNEEN